MNVAPTPAQPVQPANNPTSSLNALYGAVPTQNQTKPAQSVGFTPQPLGFPSTPVQPMPYGVPPNVYGVAPNPYGNTIPAQTMPIAYGMNPAAANPYHMTPTQSIHKPATTASPARGPAPSGSLLETDGFDDFQTAKATGPSKATATFLSDAEANLVNLDSFTLEDDKKNDKKKETKKADDGFGNNLLFSTKEDLDMFGSNSMGGNKGLQMGAGYQPAPFYTQPGVGVGVAGMTPGYPPQPNMYAAAPPNMMGYNMGVGAQYPPQYSMGPGGYPAMGVGAYPAGAMQYNNQFKM
eukprot:TRINITY_DN1409_c0_g1_i9.p2 TRINITY_DN1409_c0_g1~~TRINITY_DN1409_c0_g1_i9.p2  ORF type:complete len:294 (+),score=48.86 TRINITY_DN1409_c0_g1_i9:645-1526(+)